MAARSEVRLDSKSADPAPLRAIPIDSLPFPAALLDAAGAITAANSAWLALYPQAAPFDSALAAAIRQTLDESHQSFDQLIAGRRWTIAPSGSGAVILSQPPPAAADDAASRTQSEKMETVGRMVGGVVHDFANLVTLIAGYGDILLNRIGAKDPLRPELEEIAKAANRGARLTAQLLGFTRGQLAQPRAIDLNAIVLDIQRMLRPIIGEYLELEIALGTDVGRVVADPGQMEQVIMNLILNARDAMPQGGRIRIETAGCELDAETAQLHGMQAGPGVLFTISDTGHGIDAAALSRVFEPFFTTKEKGKGTGLGLHTVHRIIKESGGDIWVRSEPGSGATFSICLPRTREGAESGDTRGSERQAAAGRETVLLVEDEEGVRRLLTQVLRKRGYQVIEACNAEEALSIFADRMDGIHLVLTDMVMPGLSGRELAVRLREIGPKLRIVFMSGYTDDVLMRTGALSPGMSFLQKPLRPDVLAACIREALDSPVLPFNPR